MIAPEDYDKWLCKPNNVEDLSKKILTYMQNRWPQKLTGLVDIDVLVARFISREIRQE